jgi:hypothetical protein
MGRGEVPVPREGSTTMIKLNQSGANINVLDEAQLGNVIGGHRGGHRKYNNYGHCYDKKRYDYCKSDYNYSDCYDSKSYGDDSYRSDDDCYDYDSKCS